MSRKKREPVLFKNITSSLTQKILRELTHLVTTISCSKSIIAHNDKGAQLKMVSITLYLHYFYKSQIDLSLRRTSLMFSLSGEIFMLKVRTTNEKPKSVAIVVT